MSPIKQLLTPPPAPSQSNKHFGTLFCQPGAFSKVLKPYMHSPLQTKKNGECPNRRSAFHKCAYLMTSGLCRLSHIFLQTPIIYFNLLFML